MIGLNSSRLFNFYYPFRFPFQIPAYVEIQNPRRAVSFRRYNLHIEIQKHPVFLLARISRVESGRNDGQMIPHQHFFWNYPSLGKSWIPRLPHSSFQAYHEKPRC